MSITIWYMLKISISTCSYMDIYIALMVNLILMQVVCSHAVKVKPTPNLNQKMAGYLPIHCVHQLIQSKAFRKHGVSIKVGRAGYASIMQ